MILCFFWLHGWTSRQSLPLATGLMMFAWTLHSQSYKINAFFLSFIHLFIYLFTQVLFFLPFTTDRLEDRKDVRTCNPICPALWIITMSASPLSVCVWVFALRAFSACKADILQPFLCFVACIHVKIAQDRRDVYCNLIWCLLWRLLCAFHTHVSVFLWLRDV